MSSSDSKHFKPGFLSNLNRSFRIRSSLTSPASKKDNGVPKAFDQIDEAFGPSAFSSIPKYGDQEVGNFRRCHSINVNRKQHQGLVRIPEMPLKGDLLKRVWNDGLDNSASSKELDVENSKPMFSEIATPRIDSYRFSMANLEDSQEVDLDAILSQLCALESKCDEEIRRNSYSTNLSNGEKPTVIGVNCHQNIIQPQPLIPAALQRTDSPDNDSAFSDTVSMLSSESSTSSGVSAPNKLHQLQLNLHNNKDTAVQAKAEKIRMALEKMVKASVKKLFIKAFSVDGSSKSLLVDEKMTCGYVTRLLADKNHVDMEPKWALIEYLPELQMERIFEDHEILVDNLMLWARDSKNKIFFSERPEKISLFQNPEMYLISEDDKNFHKDYDDHSRSVLIEEFFNAANAQTSTLPLNPEILSFPNHPVPPMEGPLYLKNDSKKGWKKYHFVLKSCGLYYYPKDKAKSKEMVLLSSFEVNEIYIGISWKKKHKAPTDYCFALKHPRLQQPKCVKFVKFLCAEDKKSFDKWLVAMRIAKHGRQLLDNYRTLADDLAQEDLDQLANARSYSVMSIIQNNLGTPRRTILDSPSVDILNKTIYSEGSITGSSDLSSGRHSCISSSSSSGCMSDGGPSGSEGNAFDSEFSTGTIKRKPTMKPNIPLTSMTRQLKEMVDSNDCSSYSNSNMDSSVNSSHNNTFAYTSTGTLTRRTNRRNSIRSNNTDESSSGSGTLKRHCIKNCGSSESMTSCNSSSSGCNTPSKNILVHDSFTSTNGNQSPEIRMQNKSGDSLPTTGILLGFLTQQNIVPSHEYLLDDSCKIAATPDILSGENGKSGQSAPFYVAGNQASFITNMHQSNINSRGTYDDDIDNMQNMPLPPPPNFLNDDMNFSFDPMFSSTLSLESLPPPPPLEMQSLNCNNLSESQLSLMSLPPPPSLSEMCIASNENFDPGKNYAVEKNHVNETTVSSGLASPQSIIEKIEFYNSANRTSLSHENKEKDLDQFRQSISKQEPVNKPKIKLPSSSGVAAIQSSLQNKSAYCSPPVEYSHYSTNPIIKAENVIPFNLNSNGFQQTVNIEQKRIQNQISSPVMLRKPTQNKTEDSETKTPVLRRKQVSFNDTPSPICSNMLKKKSNVSLPDPQILNSSIKPPLPKRNENTRLSSSPVKIADACDPPVDFLKDLQRVMRKKWQVAQKCKLEPTTTPHEILGFREYPILSEDYKETNVSNWVQEHYGHCGHTPNLYENINSKQNDKATDYVDNRFSVTSGSTIDGSTSGSKKKPPPPIPKRSENTHLSNISIQKSH